MKMKLTDPYPSDYLPKAGEDKPHPFIRGNFVAECIQHSNGQRSIVVYHKNLSVYECHKPHIYDPFAIFTLANWMVKASNWVGQPIVEKAEEQSTKKKRRKKKKHPDDLPGQP